MTYLSTDSLLYLQPLSDSNEYGFRDLINKKINNETAKAANINLLQ